MEWHLVGFCFLPVASFAKLSTQIRPHTQREIVFGMLLKRTVCKDRQLRSCCDLAERNARLWLTGQVTQQRFEELTDDLRQTCEIAATYQEWLMKNCECLRLRGGRWNDQNIKEKRKVLQECIAASPSR